MQWLIDRLSPNWFAAFYALVGMVLMYGLQRLSTGGERHAEERHRRREVAVWETISALLARLSQDQAAMQQSAEAPGVPSSIRDDLLEAADASRSTYAQQLQLARESVPEWASARIQSLELSRRLGPFLPPLATLSLRSEPDGSWTVTIQLEGRARCLGPPDSISFPLEKGACSGFKRPFSTDIALASIQAKLEEMSVVERFRVARAELGSTGR